MCVPCLIQALKARVWKYEAPIGDAIDGVRLRITFKLGKTQVAHFAAIAAAWHKEGLAYVKAAKKKGPYRTWYGSSKDIIEALIVDVEGDWLSGVSHTVEQEVVFYVRWIDDHHNKHGGKTKIAAKVSAHDIQDMKNSHHFQNGHDDNRHHLFGIIPLWHKSSKKSGEPEEK